MAREPYYSNMKELLRDEKADETFRLWMIDEAGSSHSDVLAWRHLETVYAKVRNIDLDVWELWYPIYFATDHHITGQIWLCKRGGSGSPMYSVKRFDSLAEAQEMADLLNEGHRIMWLKKIGQET